MKKILKYPLSSVGEQFLLMPKDAKVLTVQMQHNQMCLWALVDISKSVRRYKVNILGTGHEFNEIIGPYVATVQDGQYVWHVFVD